MIIHRIKLSLNYSQLLFSVFAFQVESASQ